MYNYNATRFFMSVPKIYRLSNNKNIMGIEVAFVGYSNSGKSSVINALTGKKKLTKVSKNPGCTRFINFFEVQLGVYLIDFPGYGYSNDNTIQKDYWNHVIYEYLKKISVKGLIVVIDIRRSIRSLDKKIIEKALLMNIPILVLLNKSDKISKNTLCIMSKKIIKDCQSIFSTDIQVEIFSAVKKYGIFILHKILNNWLK
ncbi:ribosome biogenesis GTP-binding protein YihA/YsxC [Candidatus Blochmannia ocreatus (nom. nud.)]|uniref:Probable GTP-binding protein EngB n=1 Tax=Candidatus Blochmannia ocreatus (nom. nud.) TaxID=251538 RepID=A0ABY4SXT5_9ENTR|nr:ribosome biogenesis GTP-binding protein YihA/YsxC [Candidatus Blochmannia ocreatus]URJ25083.1 ribosome biogenesis GTP-binding protein YihA/YsxC [Candidatus Blochmannia ocreatus]